jgi:hypothetical protein
MKARVVVALLVTIGCAADPDGDAPNDGSALDEGRSEARPAETVQPDAQFDAGGAGGDAAADLGVAEVSPVDRADVGAGEVADVVVPIEPVIDVLDLNVQDLVFDPLRRRAYATLRAANLPDSQGLAIIDPFGRRVLSTMPVGASPAALALSDDRSTLWISVEGARAIRKLNLQVDPPALGPLVALPRGPGIYGETTAGSLQVLPGTPDSVVVSLRHPLTSYDYAGLAVVDDGDGDGARFLTTSGYCDAARLTGGPAGYLFAYNRLTTNFAFCSVHIAAQPVALKSTENLLTNFDNDIVYRDGRVYAFGGEVIDVSDPEAPRTAGRFAFSGAVLPQANRRIVMMSPGRGATPTLRILEGETFTQVASVALPQLHGVEFGALAQIDDDTIMAEAAGFGDFSRVAFVRSGLLHAR